MKHRVTVLSGTSAPHHVDIDAAEPRVGRAADGEVMIDPIRLAEGAVIAGRFHLISRAGRGAMGEVWLARHGALDVPCAVKILHAEMVSSPEFRARFELEARVAARLRGPHVIDVLDLGVFGETPYIVMEYLVGETLAARLARVSVLDPSATVAVVDQVARALARAHGAGVIHRDIKPGNVFWGREDDREIVKVLDFGVAKYVGVHRGGATHGLTRMGTLIGTPSYMSPEQAQALPSVDHRSDLWALGVVAYRCLTGQLPFRGNTIGELLLQIVVDPIPVPSRVAPVPAGFDVWWARASARDREQRFQSAGEMAEALRLAVACPAAPEGDAQRSTAPFPLVTRKGHRADGLCQRTSP